MIGFPKSHPEPNLDQEGLQNRPTKWRCALEKCLIFLVFTANLIFSWEKDDFSYVIDGSKFKYHGLFLPMVNTLDENS